MNRVGPNSPFLRLVSGLKEQGKTMSVVESCCGGLIQASVMAIPGSSAGRVDAEIVITALV
jgi:nicotinamide mononucleotide (NMN) deamidase PncC